MTWTFTVPRPVPSRNERTRKHWYQVRADLAKWAADLLAIKRQMGIPDTSGKRAVTITRLLGKGQKFFDPDNLDTKTLIDAMKPARILMRKGVACGVAGAGLIVDDSLRYLVLMPSKQERAADGKPGTRITLCDVEKA